MTRTAPTLALGIFSAAAAFGVTAEPLLDVDFSQHAEGAYGLEQWRQDFPDAPWQSGGIGSGRAEVAGPERSLRVAFPNGSVGPGDGSANAQGGNGGGGVNFPAPLTRNVAAAAFSYSFEFEDGFSFSRGGKLPGLASIGTGNAIPSGGRAADGENGFSARAMWFTGGRAAQYVYHLDVPEAASPYGDRFYWAHADGSDVLFEEGTTYDVRTEVRLNTPGEADGSIRTILNDELVLDRDGLRFRTVDEVLIDRAYISTFHGGADISWAPEADSFMRFDDFLVNELPDATQVVPEPGTLAVAAAMGLLVLRRRRA